MNFSLKKLLCKIILKCDDEWLILLNHLLLLMLREIFNSPKSLIVINVKGNFQ